MDLKVKVKEADKHFRNVELIAKKTMEQPTMAQKNYK